jgi:hypothetical protein
MMMRNQASFTIADRDAADSGDTLQLQATQAEANLTNLGLIIIAAAPPPGLDRAIDALAPESLPNFRLEGPVALVMAWLNIVVATPGLLPEQAWIVGDVARQARRFADLTGSTHVALKLEVVRDNACRKLHHDYVAHRLVCTYRGPGTQWLGRDHEVALADEREVVPDHWLTAIPRFASAVFAGVLLPGARPILHRSPPIAGTDTIRLVLTINEPFSGRIRG